MHFSLLLCVGKMARVLLALALLYVAVVAHAFRMSPQRFGGALIGGNRVRQSSSMIVNVKPDLFSDDLFEDDEEESSAVSNVKNEKEVPKKKYLEEKWKLNSEDQKEFQGFDGSNVDNSVTAEKVPCFALMYKFRKEFVDVSVDAVMADHKGHCGKFKRLLNTELINLGKAKGVVLLWAGFDDDKEDTRAEIMSFLEEDPLITKDYVSNWDLLDLSAQGKSDAAPSELPAAAE